MFSKKLSEEKQETTHTHTHTQISKKLIMSGEKEIPQTKQLLLLQFNSHLKDFITSCCKICSLKQLKPD